MLALLASETVPSICPPLPESLAALHALIAAGCVVLGVALVVRGLKLSRCMMALVGGCVGAAGAASWLEVMPDLNPLAIYGCCIGGGIVLGALTARLWVGLVAGVALGSAAMLWILHTNAGGLDETVLPVLQASGAKSLALWATAVYQDGWNYAQVAVRERQWTPIALVGLAFLIPLVLAILLRRLAMVIVSAVIGAAMVLVALLTLAVFGGMVDDMAGWLYSLGMLIAWGAVSLAGIIVQLCTVFRKPKGEAKAPVAEDAS